MATYKWRNNILCEVLIIYQGKMKLLAKKMVDEIEPCLVIANLDGCSPKHFWIYCITTRKFFVHCVPKSQWLFLTMRNDHWECSEPKRLQLIVYILFFYTLLPMGVMGVSELRKESCLQWKHHGIKPRCQHWCANLCTMALEMSIARLVQPQTI